MLGHARWTSASSVFGATDSVSASIAKPPDAGRLRLIAPAAAAALALEHAAGRDLDALDVGVLRPGHVREVGRGDHALPAGAQHLDEPLAPARVQLAHDVVEQHQRWRAALLGQLLALRQQQRQQARAAAGPRDP